MSGDSSSGLSLGLANRIYLSGRDFDLAPDFKDKGREYFGAEPEEVDFALQETTEQINRWVEGQVRRIALIHLKLVVQLTRAGNDKWRETF